ncbi:hypothetical protein QBC34DRAFT_94731 [Podospora aff. communis PSN243]|uniref:Uncharacterized protein n=1 Tax=Podospora aff. communis PSN243 TaxID=3040156 RepID=A0AAV9GL61_9PEZI|nr:hypothetical protein QBC34DRAFT_94731 [Podospora aff. communis PSN243]
MESIQLAQMLADLSDLNAAEAQAAVALVNANKSLPSTSTPATAAEPSKAPADGAPVRPGQRHHQRMGSASSIISRTASPAKFDKFGRRILTPPMSRTNSAQGSIPGTPGPELEDDVEKANSLMALYDIRMKVKEQDHTSLLKLREKIAALQARQQAEKKEASATQQHSRYTYPKAPA